MKKEEKKPTNFGALYMLRINTEAMFRKIN